MFAPAKADARRRGGPAALPVYLFRSGSTEGTTTLRCPKSNRSGRETRPQAFAFLRRVPLNTVRVSPPTSSVSLSGLKVDGISQFPPRERNHRPPR